MPNAFTNDWIVLGLENPSKSTSDFVNFGNVTTKNTQLLSRDEYLRSPYIQNHPMFKGENGNFSQTLFDNYYNMRLYEYYQLQTGEFYDGPALDIFGGSGNSDTPALDFNFHIGVDLNNPNNLQIGVGGINVVSEPERSIRELAQNNRVFNYTTQTWENYSPNDHALSRSPLQWFKDFYREPLVLAAWDSDGTHLDPVTGIEVEHKMGEIKTDDNGHAYYETLGNRSDIGKQILPFWDVLSVDGRGINCIDFFDSDDIDKTVSGCISRSISKIAPLFFGNKIKAGYTILTIVKDLLTEVPVFEGLVSGGDPFNGNKTVNAIASRAKRFDFSASDYAQEHMVSFENLSNVVGDVALQLNGQQMIANGFGRVSGASRRLINAQKRAESFAKAKIAAEGFRGDPKAVYDAARMMFVAPAEASAQKAWRLGADISIAYMVSSQAREVYEDAINHGTTRREAAIMSLGSMIGMYSVDKYLGLGELFLKAPGLQRDVTRAVSREILAMRDIYSRTHNSTEVGLLTRTLGKVKNFYTRYRNGVTNHTLPFAVKVLGEGFEEVGEEVMADMSKQIYQWLGTSGICNTTVNDVGAWEKAGERYFMNFIGGAIGGAVFAGSDAFRNRGRGNQITDRNMLDLIVNGHSQLLYNELDRQHRLGRTGSKTLSTESSPDEKGNSVWLTTTNPEESQAHQTYQAIKNEIMRTEAILQVNKDLSLTDEQLFERLYATAHIANNYEKFLNVAKMARYKEKYRSLLGNLTDAEIKLIEAEKTIEGVVGGNPRPDPNSHIDPAQQQTRNQNLDKIRAEIETHREALRSFLSTETSADYIRMMGAMIDPIVYNAFFSEEDYKEIQKLTNKFVQEGEGSIDTSASADEQEIARRILYVSSFNKAKMQYLGAQFETLWKRFKEIEQFINPLLHQLGSLSPTYRAQLEEINKILASENFSDSIIRGYSVYKYDTRLDDETDDEYEHRNKKYDNESDEDFEARKLERAAKLDEIFANDILEVLEKSGNDTLSLDSQVLSRIKTILPRQIRNIYISELNKDLRYEQKDGLQFFVGGDDILLYNKIVNILRTLDYTDSDNMISEIKKVIYEHFRDFAFTRAEKIYNHVLSDGTTIADRAAEIYENINDGDPDESFIDPETGQIKDPRSIKAFEGIDDNIKQEIIDFLLMNGSILDVTTARLSDIFESEEKLADRILSQTSLDSENYYTEVFGDSMTKTKNNNLYRLYKSVSSNAYNPIVQLVASFISTINNEGEAIIPDFMAVLETLEGNFQNLKSIDDFMLGQDNIDKLIRTRDVLTLIGAYVRMAGAETKGMDIIGHNKAVNEYAERNKKRLRGEWEKLPELDEHDYMLYEKTIEQYIQTINFWLNMAVNSAQNKIRQINFTNDLFFKEMYSLIKNIGHINVILPDGTTENVDLLAGIENINENYLDMEHGASIVPFEHIARILRNNVENLAKRMETTVADLLINKGLLSHLVDNLDQIHDSSVITLNETFKATEMNPYSKAIFYTSILLGDTQEFFKNLKEFYNNNDNLIPMADQIFNRFIIATASKNTSFFDVVEYIYNLNKTNLGSAHLPNVIFSEAPAGGGKTTVLASSAVQFVNDEDLIVCAPNNEQVLKLKDNIGKGKPMTITEFLKSIIDESQLQDIENEIEKNKDINPNTATLVLKYFTRTLDRVGLIKIKLNDPDKIKWKNLSKTPSHIVIDEAIDMNTVEGLLISEWAKKNNVVIHMLGDQLQTGYSENIMDNLGAESVFALRTLAMTMSLRETNMQKAYNLDIIRNLLLNIKESYLYDTKADFNAKLETWLTILKAINLRACTRGDVLNGEILSDKLSSLDISRLKKLNKNGNIAFIGDPNSKYLKQLKDAGINPKVFNLGNVKSQEFDYVIVDYDFPSEITTSYDLYLMTKDLYTLMSRSKNGTIIISKTLQKFIGTTNFQQASGQAISTTVIRNSVRPSMMKYIDEILNGGHTDQTGTTTVVGNEQGNNNGEVTQPNTDQDNGNDENTPPDTGPENNNGEGTPPDVGQENTTDNNAPTDTEPENEEHTDDTENGQQPAFPPTTNADEMIKDPDENDRMNHNRTPTDVINETDVEIKAVDSLNDFPIIGYGDAVFTGATFVDGHWEFSTEGNVLRNLAGIVRNKKVANTYDAINILHNTRGVIKYKKANYDELPSGVKEVFARKDWNAGIYEVEFRRITEHDNFVSGSTFSEKGVEVDLDGKKERVIAEIVYSVKRKDGKTVKIDLGGLNLPKTLLRNQQRIVSNLRSRLKEAKDERTRNLLLKKINAITEERIIQYSNWFNDMCKQAVNSKDGVVAKQISDVFFNQTTWISKNDNDKPIVGREILRIHPNLVFSQIYVCTDNGEMFEANINPSMAGRFVIFCAPKESGLTGDQLIARYKEQKTKQGTPDEIQAVVRKLVIDPVGKSFLEWSRSTNTEEERKKMIGFIPRTFLGIRMFTSMWNARAALLNLKDALDSFCRENNITDQTHIDQLIKGARFIDEDPAKFHNAQEIVRKAIQDYGFTEAQLRAFKEKFANEYCKDIPMFRLYYRDTTREIVVPTNSVAYTPNSTVRIWCININSLNKYTDILNNILDQVQKLIVNKDPFKFTEKEYINLSEDSHKRCLSGLMHTAPNGNITIKDEVNKQTLKIPVDGSWGAIPYLVVRMVDTMRARHVMRRNGVEQTGRSEDIKFEYKVSTGRWRKPIKETLSFNLGDNENYVATVRLLEGITTGRMIKTEKQSSHRNGTGIDVLTVDEASESRPLTDAYFKHGIQTPPTLLRSNGEIVNESGARIRPEESELKVQSWYYMVDASIDQFTLDHPVRISGVEVSLGELVENKPTDHNNNEGATSESESNDIILPIRDRVEAAQLIPTLEKTCTFLSGIAAESPVYSSTLVLMKDMLQKVIANNINDALVSYSDLVDDAGYINLVRNDASFKEYVSNIGSAIIDIQSKNINNC